MNRSNNLRLSLDEVSSKLKRLGNAPQPMVYSDAPQEDSNSPLSLRFMHKPSRLNYNSVDPGAEAEQNSRRNSVLSEEGLHIRDAVKHHENAIDESGSDSEKSDPDAQTAELRPQRPPLVATSSNESIGYKLVRKKSGEILKPSLKDSASYFSHHASSKSLPTTPTYKSVHFGDSSDVRYFKKKDRPTAISATNSPTLASPEFTFEADYDSEDEHYDSEDTTDAESYRRFAYGPGPDDDDDFYSFNLNSSGSTNYPNPKHKKLIDWKLELLNFPDLSYDYKIKFENAPVFLERIFITIDKKFLLGHLAVKNLSFEKVVTVRYTLDNWRTIVEIPTIYVPDVPSILKQNNYDRFIFKIPLNNLFNSFRMTTDMLNYQDNVYDFCFKYNANNTEFWDNNNYNNYRIKLIKVIENKQQADPEPEAVPMRKSNSFTSFGRNISSHRARPKYSSNYLKRRSSDSNLAKKNGEASLFSDPANNNTSDSLSDFSSNDFIKNNYYLSSPLLSSLNNQDDIGNHSNVSTENLTPAKSVDYEDELTVKPFDYNSNNFFKDNTINSKSYKELLDTYCFFNSSSNGAPPEVRTSTPPTSASAPSSAKDPDPDDTLTVSSLLGK